MSIPTTQWLEEFDSLDPLGQRDLVDLGSEGYELLCRYRSLSAPLVTVSNPKKGANNDQSFERRI